jgi:transposase
LRLERIYPGKKSWGGAHTKWLAGQAFAHLERRIGFAELIQVMEEARARVARLEKAIAEVLLDWSLAPMVTALMAMRGFDLVAGTTILAEAGDLGRFRTPGQLMAWLGLVPSDASTGDRVRRFGIAKAGNSRARGAMIESAWCYRHPARVAKLARVEAARRIPWKVQTQLAARYRALIRKGKLETVGVTAVARELTGAIDRALREEPTAV